MAPKDTGKMGLGKAIIPFAFEVRRIYWLMYVCIYEYMSISRHITMRLIYNIYDKSHIFYIYIYICLYMYVYLSLSHTHTQAHTHTYLYLGLKVSDLFKAHLAELLSVFQI